MAISYVCTWESDGALHLFEGCVWMALSLSVLDLASEVRLAPISLKRPALGCRRGKSWQFITSSILPISAAHLARNNRPNHSIASPTGVSLYHEEAKTEPVGSFGWNICSNQAHHWIFCRNTRHAWAEWFSTSPEKESGINATYQMSPQIRRAF